MVSCTRPSFASFNVFPSRFVGVAVIALALSVGACSGAEPSEALTPDTETSPTTPVAADAGRRASVTGEDLPAVSSTPGGEACIKEVEPNDAVATATSFRTSICGTLSDGDDVDFFSFQAPADAELFHIKHKESGDGIAYRIYINGAPLPRTIEKKIPAIPGATYQLQVRRDGQGTGDVYRIDVIFE